MKYTILYIDDEEVNLRIFRSVFRREFKIFTAPSGKEGLEILSHEKCDLIVTDQRMPGMTGLEFLKRVYHMLPSKPPNRIILSGYSSSIDIDKARKEYGLYKFVSKPWNAEDLKVIMNTAIKDCFRKK
ncbi:MAG: response regulator [Flavobacteriales bacterium]|nr:response regulator [Flavobacteriales bacterium]